MVDVSLYFYNVLSCYFYDFILPVPVFEVFVFKLDLVSTLLEVFGLAD